MGPTQLHSGPFDTRSVRFSRPALEAGPEVWAMLAGITVQALFALGDLRSWKA